MKKFTLVVLALCCALIAWSQNKRRVLVEEFTQASCGPCAQQNPAFNTKLLNNAAIVTPIKYQTSWPGVDPMNQQNPKDVADRVTYYGVNGVPNGFLNGVVAANDCGFYEGAPACIDEDEILAAHETNTPVSIKISHSFTADFDSILVTVSVTSDEELSGKLRLRTAILESKINFVTAPGSNGEKDFSHVMRKLLPSSDGTATGDFKKGETKTYNFAWAYDIFYEPDNMEAIAWLQNDDSKEIYQSEVSAPNTDIPGGSYARVVLSAANLNRFTCEQTVKPVFQLRNTGTAQLKTAEVLYRPNGQGAWKLFNWTGTLNANATVTVTLPDVTFNAAGPNTVNIRIANTNNGLQANQIDGAGTIFYTAMFGSQKLPFANDFEGMTSWPPAGYGIKNTAAGSGWRAFVDGGNNSDGSIICPFFVIQSGAPDLFLPRLDLTEATTATLTFDHAYCWYDGVDGIFKDRFQIDISGDCGATWTNLFNKTGDDLATADPRDSFYFPAQDEWSENQINMSQFAGKKDLLIRLRGTSSWGNNLYLDNFAVSSVSGTNNVVGLGKVEIRPNPAYDQSELRFSLEQPQSLQLMVYNAEGRLLESKQLGELPSGDHIAPLDASKLSNGTYRVSLQSKEGVATMQWFIMK